MRAIFKSIRALFSTGETVVHWNQKVGKAGLVSSVLLLLLVPLNVWIGLGGGEPRSKFYLYPFLQEVAGISTGQPVWATLGVWSAQDTALVIFSLIWLGWGWMMANNDGLISLKDLMKVTGNFKREEKRALRIGMKVTTAGGLMGTIEHISPEKVRVRTGAVSVYVDKSELEEQVSDSDDAPSTYLDN